ncbi:hypothetical protein PC116_g34263 [Phytophthora cactorum]|nr:hypothetical protein PC116_g34263 [Phytophthora cactorum]
MKQVARYRAEKSVIEPAVKQLLDEEEVEMEELVW